MPIRIISPYWDGYRVPGTSFQEALADGVLAQDVAAETVVTSTGGGGATGFELWDDVPAGLTQRTELIFQGATAHTLADNERPGVATDWQHFEANPTCDYDIIAATDCPIAPPSGSSHVLRITFPEATIDAASQAVVPGTMAFTISPETHKRGYGGIVMMLATNFEFHETGGVPSGNKWFFVRKTGTSNMLVGALGTTIRRSMNWSGGATGVCYNGQNSGGTMPLGQWVRLTWNQSKPPAFPATGEEWLHHTRFATTATGWEAVATSFNISRTYCEDDDNWNNMMLSCQHGGGDPDPINSDNVIYVDAMSWWTAATSVL